MRSTSFGASTLLKGLQALFPFEDGVAQCSAVIQPDTKSSWRWLGRDDQQHNTYHVRVSGEASQHATVVGPRGDGSGWCAKGQRIAVPLRNSPCARPLSDLG